MNHLHMRRLGRILTTVFSFDIFDADGMEQQISKEFLEMKNIQDISWECISGSVSSGNLQQDHIITATVNHPVAKLYPPSTDYIKSFLKNLIQRIEACNVEVSEEIYQIFLKYLDKKENADYYYRTYSINDSLKITIRETGSLVVAGTTGLTTWQASHVLAQYCLTEKLQMESAEILELGSGLGLTGLTLIKAFQPKFYTFTDNHPSVLEYLKHNVSINLVPLIQLEDSKDYWHARWKESEVFVETLDWERPRSVHQSDIVLAADVLFDPELITPLLMVIGQALKSASSRAIIAATIRNADTIKLFVDAVEKFGLYVEKTEQVSYERSRSYPETLVKVFRLKRMS